MLGGCLAKNNLVNWNCSSRRSGSLNAGYDVVNDDVALCHRRRQTRGKLLEPREPTQDYKAVEPGKYVHFLFNTVTISTNYHNQNQSNLSFRLYQSTKSTAVAKMYLPNAQSILTAGLAMTGMVKDTSTVAKGKVLDYAVEKCVDSEGNARCSKPFLVARSTCYQIEWSTEGTLTHTTAEVRDAGSGELVYYRDTNGEWTPEKGELVYLDFKPKVVATGNQTVEYKVKTCE
ncbi:hypothetical protein BKA67DRAFT_580173 [Truncatella angustata]|uniref:Uncharacterized protein n=1 Tax=Truncatella angustata TaxID=152316 RepID=A0A9P8RIV6_9PEZI|nr:uncharacterized protein BKA67DRAFT_580173 [Truncatella angustata]KAH6646664.1 hypothetical protein BKA67DRAFT_580173 [Truncatella angustata]